MQPLISVPTSVPLSSGSMGDRTAELIQSYQQIRQFSETLCAPLVIEDYGLQSMPDVSPPKWHLAHTTWFFETFLLVPSLPSYQVFHPQFGYLFNSYYEAIGQRHPRPQRGLLSRPTVAEVYQYRAYVDQAMQQLIQEFSQDAAIADLLILGLHHEQQHQELLLTDLKYNFAINPLRPAYRTDLPVSTESAPTLDWVTFTAGLYEIGYEAHPNTTTLASNFAFDNESPRHAVYLNGFRLANRLVTNGEYLEFIQAGGYQNPEYWLAEGWGVIQAEGWTTPLYWEQRDGDWWVMTLAGLRSLNLAEPVCHVSFYEADAYARWAGKRLPTEAEWEVAAATTAIAGNLVEQDSLHPMPAPSAPGLTQLFGDAWEWTQSAYLPYPGYRPAPGAVGEYNGKFMCNQMVLRGGSCATSLQHIRPSYRNFFPTNARWQFSGIRLAADLD